MSESLPHSSFQVLHVLARKGPLNPKQIRELVRIPARTVAFALKRLLKTGLVCRIPNLMDMRKTLYNVESQAAHTIIERHGAESMIGIQLSVLFR
ncbi:MAG: hypothetical protein BAJATHORv1_110058 [Candidatus Thorarchaeota archaeon]|nr:MAG: hypothetical protein BAJATHORv1_110058 [Candidatus Thorarchaeota archaeon]